jgi:hypothetical protein
MFAMNTQKALSSGEVSLTGVVSVACMSFTHIVNNMKALVWHCGFSDDS